MDHEQQIARAVQLAHENIKRGIIREPRVYFDLVQMVTSTTQIAFCHTDVFRNGEDYPVRIHALTAAVRATDSTDERQIQRIGMRLMGHDHYYMQREFVPIPSWHNKVCSPSPLMAFGQSGWKLHTPFVLSSRDAMDIRAQLVSTPSNERDITFSMTGVGMDSMRPYFKSSTQTYDAALTPAAMDPEDLRNDGDEPILITDVTVHCSAADQSNNPQGDIRQADISIRQIGNGTQAVWMNGPIGQDDLCPAALLGLTNGRAVVHCFPLGSEVLWEPGEGLRVEFQPLFSQAALATIYVEVALIGTIEVR